ncbi:hypothetical protein KAR91_66190, partial [Candidatus Pacearchaeota archaeon]|nr:hypothetical protein [Candidatus Pacearchaeota archaeon]
MASSRRLPLSYNTSTYDSAGGKDYSVLQTWEAATDIDLVTATNGEVLECYKGAHADNIFTSGATTNSSYFRVIKPASGEGHSGIPKSDSSCVEFHGTQNNLFTLEETYFQLHDLVLKSTAIGDYCNVIKLQFDQTKVIGCLVYDSAGATSEHRGILCNATGGTTYVINCLVHNIQDYGILAQNGTGYIYNCTATDCDVRGFQQWGGGTGIAKNCVAEDNSPAQWGGTWTKTTCTDDDGVVFNNTAGDDYTLDSTDTIAKDQGTDLSGDGNYAFDDDILGNTRSGTWDIGFHEYGAGVQFLTRDIAWEVLNTIERATGWGLLTAASTDIAYRILNTIDRDTAAKILTAKDQDTAYKILNTITRDTASKIFSSLDRDSSWAIIAKSERDTSWNIINRLDRNLAWGIKTVKEQITGYRIMTAKGQNTAWTIANAVIRDTSWDILNTKDQHTAWGILAQISRDTSWKVFTVTDQDLAWDILTYLEQDTGWQLFDAVSLDTAWDVFSDIVPEP